MSDSEPSIDHAKPDRTGMLAYLVAGAFFMENLDATVITTAVPAMAASFGVAPTALSTGISAYLVALAVFIPVSGWVADRFGPRQVLAGAILVFTLASVLCGLADTLPMFVAARVLQGMGGALMVPVGRMVVVRSAPKSELVKALAIITWPGLAAPILGPPLGGWIASTWTWHWIFFLNLPLGLIAAVLALRWVSGAPGGRRPFDWTGFVSSGAGLGLLMMGLDLMTQPVIDWPMTALMMGAGSISLAYALWHMRRSPHPLVPLAVFKVPTFRAAVLGGTLARTAISSAPFLLPLMFQLALGFGMIESGFLMLALFAGNLGMKVGTTRVLRALGFRGVLLVNGLLVALGFVACAAFTHETPLLWMIVVLVIGGMTRSMQFTTLAAVAFCDTSPQQAGSASTLVSMFHQLAAGIGIGIGAMALRFSQVWSGHTGAPALSEFRFALCLMAGLMLLSLIDAARLPASAGHHVSGHQPGSK
jgi:EmrB/QacA subfamily drug resistance transporter